MAVGRDGELLARVALLKDVADDFHQDGLSRTALLDNESVRTLHLRSAAVEQAAFVLAEVNFVHHLLNVAAVGAHEVDDFLPVLLAAALEDVAEGVEQDIVTGVAAVSLVAEEQGRPLVVGHSSGAGVGQHIDRQHARRESELIPVGCVQRALALLDGNFRNIADCESVVVRSGNVQRIVSHVFVHINYLQ